MDLSPTSAAPPRIPPNSAGFAAGALIGGPAGARGDGAATRRGGTARKHPREQSAGRNSGGETAVGKPPLRQNSGLTAPSEQRVGHDAEGGDGAGVAEAVDGGVGFLQDGLRVAEDAVVVEEFAEGAFAFG